MAQKEIQRLPIIRNEENTSSSKTKMREEERFKEIRGFSDSYELRTWSSDFIILVFSVK